MISDFDKCIFVHIPKVAGQSIEQFFLERAGLNWHSRAPFLLKKNKKPTLGPPRLAHLTAQEYVELGYISDEKFSQYFSFSFVRNPWDRVVSEYKYRKYPFSFNDFLFKKFPTPSDDNYEHGLDAYRHVLPQADFLFDAAGEQLVDFIGRFERLKDDFHYVSEKVTGLKAALPHKNKSDTSIAKKLSNMIKRSDYSHYSSYYNDEARAFVAEKYKRDIEMFGYSFESGVNKSL